MEEERSVLPTARRNTSFNAILMIGFRRRDVVKGGLELVLNVGRVQN